MDEDEELLSEFILESRESLDAVDDAFLALEDDPTNLEPVREIFRSLHTIKGTSGFMGLKSVERISHAGESLLALVRDGELTATDDITEALLSTVDELRTCLDFLSDGEVDDPENHTELIERLTSLKNGERIPTPASTHSTDANPEHLHDQPEPADDVPDPPLGDEYRTPRTKMPLGKLLAERGVISQTQLRQAVNLQHRGDTRMLGELLVALGATTEGNIRRAVGAQEADETASEVSNPIGEDASVRVDVGLLDRIITTVGELVLSRNQLVQAADSGADVSRKTQELAHITSSLQEEALRTRMQRVSTAWRALPRITRDVAKVSGKLVTLETSGESIELDRTIIEAIRDPLMHLVRNAVDHGIEPADVREKAGKPRQGTVTLSATQDSSHVIIEVADDGAGMDAIRIGEKAVEKDLITRSEMRSMSESELLSLILRPGFSTAEKVTTVSGRGVGMDVVESNIRSVRGNLEVGSDLGKGSRFRLVLPLTLAIVPALIVVSGENLYAIPQSGVIELVRIRAGEIDDRIVRVQGAPILRLRDQLMPLVDLATVIGSEGARDQSALTVVMAQTGGTRFGLIVDRVSQAEEIVVKPISPEIQVAGVYAGATVMSDGSAALILDIGGIAVKSGIAARSMPDRPETTDRTQGDDLLAIINSEAGGVKVAVPSRTVARLAKIDPSDIETAGRHFVVQYRGGLLPLIDVRAILGMEPRDLATHPTQLRVIVTHEDNGDSVGLVVDRVSSVTEVHSGMIDRLGAGDRSGLAGTVVSNSAVTHLLDVDTLVASVERGRVDTFDRVSGGPADSHESLAVA